MGAPPKLSQRRQILTQTLSKQRQTRAFRPFFGQAEYLLNRHLLHACDEFVPSPHAVGVNCPTRPGVARLNSRWRGPNVPSTQLRSACPLLRGLAECPR